MLELPTLMLAFLSATAPPDLSAKHFVETLYAPYINAKGITTGYSPLQSRNEELDIFSLGVVRLLDADAARTPKGEEGALDYDPLCQCQDSDGMSLKSVEQVKQTRSSADIIVTLRFASTPSQIRKVHLFLIREEHGWRVDNVLSSKGQTLRQLLQPKNLK